jgi:hypothetical protein
VSEKAIKLVQYISGLTLSEYGVLISLASMADKDSWRCRPSLSTLAVISNVKRKTAIRAVQRLTAPYKLPDLRPLVHRVKSSKVSVSNVYELNVELLRELKQRKRDLRRTPARARSSVFPTPPQGMANSDIEDPRRDIGMNPGTSAAKAAKKFARALLQELADLSDESLADLAEKIAVRHPRSRLRNWSQPNIGQTDKVAILDAMTEEAQIQHKTMAEVGRMMLLWLDAWDGIPRDRWQFVAEIPEFYRQGDYRLEPEELPGIDPQEGIGQHNGGSKGAEGDAESLRQFVGTGGGYDEPLAGGDSVLDRPAGIASGSEDQPNRGEGVRSITGRPEEGAANPSLFPRADRTEVFLRPTCSARIQWPRRNG